MITESLIGRALKDHLVQPCILYIRKVKLEIGQGAGGKTKTK